MIILADIKDISIPTEYGKIEIKLKNILEEKNITRYRLSQASKTRFEVVQKWYNGELEKIDSDVLARFCYCLDCDVSDIIKYIK